MATHETYTDGTPIMRAAGSNAAGVPNITMVSNEFDAGRRNAAAGDVVKVIPIPPGSFVQKVFYKVLTGDASQTVDIGDSTDPDGFAAAVNVATAGTRGMGGGALAAGVYYTSADAIAITVPTGKALDTLRLLITAVIATTL